MPLSNGKIYCATVFGVFFACQVASVQAKANKLSDRSLISVVKSEAKPDQADKAAKTFSGNVSWYGPGLHGHKTASGEMFDMNKLTAAHLSLPFGTRVQVEDPRTGNDVILRVNDRGPYVRTRVMDLSRGAARELGTLERGIAFVDCLVLETKQK